MRWREVIFFKDVKQRWRIIATLNADLRQQVDMAGICRVLEQNGAILYPHMMDCPEVRSLGLLEPEGGETRLIPPETMGGSWEWK